MIDKLTIFKKYKIHIKTEKAALKKPPDWFRILCGKSALLRSTDGAGICTSAAVEASISIDDVLTVTLRNCANGASVCTSTALDAFVRNNVSHFVVPPIHIPTFPKIWNTGNLIVAQI